MNSIKRNPILVSYAAKGILPYRGLGSGIKRAVEEWPEFDFVDDRDGCLFTVTIHRKSEKTSGKILAALIKDGDLTIPELALLIGT